MPPRAGAGGHDGPASAAFAMHFHFNGRIAAAVEDLAGMDGADVVGSHDVSEVLQDVVPGSHAVEEDGTSEAADAISAVLIVVVDGACAVDAGEEADAQVVDGAGF